MQKLKRNHGRLTIIEELEPLKSKRRVRARCQCGDTRTYRLENLLSGATTSCGCRRAEICTTLAERRELRGSDRQWSRLLEHVEERAAAKPESRLSHVDGDLHQLRPPNCHEAGIFIKAVRQLAPAEYRIEFTPDGPLLELRTAANLESIAGFDWHRN